MKRLFVLVALMLTGCYAQAGGGYSYGGGYYMGPRYYAPGYVETCRVLERCGYYGTRWCCADWREYRYGVRP